MEATSKYRCNDRGCNRHDCWDCYPTINSIRAGLPTNPMQAMTPQEMAGQNKARWDAFGGIEAETMRDKVMNANKAYKFPDAMMDDPEMIEDAASLGLAVPPIEPCDPPPSETQVGGTHYTELGIDCLELKFLRGGYEGVKHALDVKVDKYLTRNKGNHRENLMKARHCVDMMIEYYHRENG